MDNHTQAAIDTLAKDARVLVADTADAAGEKVGEARQRLSAALGSCKDMCGRVRDKAIEGAKATDHAVHEHAYQAIGIAFGIGALIAWLVTHRRSRNDG